MKKLLIWDGDNCLWNGIITEEGIDNIHLPKGRHKLCKELCNRGVLQSVASRNNLQDVLLALEKFDLTPFFVIPQASFELSKSQIIQTIVTELNISKFSDVIFVDDDKFNLKEVKYNLEDIIVDLPDNIEMIIDKYFTKGAHSEEDKHRVRRYKEEIVRKEAAKSYNGSYQDFLRKCKIRLEISNATEKDYKRIVSLLKRANRMSVLSSNLSNEDIKKNLKNILVGRVKDKFGDYSLSIFALFTKCNIEAFVISCRLQGRGIGSAFLGTLMNMNIKKVIKSEYRETQYNQGMKSLFNWYEFTMNKISNKKVLFSKKIEKAVSLPDWINVSFVLNKEDIIYRKAKKKEYGDVERLVKSTNDTILETYLKLWKERSYFDKFIPIVAVKDSKIVGMHAYTINDKYGNVCKSYYMVVDSNFKGKGIGGNLLLYTFIDSNMNQCYEYITNSSDSNNGYTFYMNFGLKPIKIEENEFGGEDYHFRVNIEGITSIEEFIERIKK